MSETNTGSERIWHLVVYGNPRTKKTSNEIHLTVHKKNVVGWVQRQLALINDPVRLIRAILSRVKVQPSKLWRKWAKDAPIVAGGGGFPVDCPCHVTATFYRERAIGDLLGYMQGIADLLQERKYITNDRLIVNWDGSRLAKDNERPRVELTIKEEVSRETS